MSLLKDTCASKPLIETAVLNRHQPKNSNRLTNQFSALLYAGRELNDLLLPFKIAVPQNSGAHYDPASYSNSAQDKIDGAG